MSVLVEEIFRNTKWMYTMEKEHISHLNLNLVEIVSFAETILNMSIH